MQYTELVNNIKLIYKKLFFDKNGQFVMAQWPNAPLIVWIIAVIASKFVSSGNVHTALGYISFSALFIWAFLEIFWGVNYFRRNLGLVVLVMAITSRFI